MGGQGAHVSQGIFEEGLVVWCGNGLGKDGAE